MDHQLFAAFVGAVALRRIERRIARRLPDHPFRA
jgi:hypothetical protein